MFECIVKLVIQYCIGGQLFVIWWVVYYVVGFLWWYLYVGYIVYVELDCFGYVGGFGIFLGGMDCMWIDVVVVDYLFECGMFGCFLSVCFGYYCVLGVVVEIQLMVGWNVVVVLQVWGDVGGYQCVFDQQCVVVVYWVEQVIVFGVDFGLVGVYQYGCGQVFFQWCFVLCYVLVMVVYWVIIEVDGDVCLVFVQ